MPFMSCAHLLLLDCYLYKESKVFLCAVLPRFTSVTNFIHLVKVCPSYSHCHQSAAIVHAIIYVYCEKALCDGIEI